MPHYHFNVFDGTELPDRDGTELPDMNSARQEAVILAGQMLVESARKFWNGEGWRMEVTDDSGLLLFRLDFTATMSPAARGR